MGGKQKFDIVLKKRILVSPLAIDKTRDFSLHAYKFDRSMQFTERLY